MKDNRFRRNQIYYGDFGQENNVGSEQKGTRPFVILQNNVGNQFSSTLIVAPITENKPKSKIDTHVMIRQNDYPLLKDSIILTEQIRTISKERVISNLIATLDDEDTKRLNEALKLSLGLVTIPFSSDKIQRGDIFLVDLGKGKGSEFKGLVPVIVVQNNVGNYYSSTLIVAPINLNNTKVKLPTHVFLEKSSNLFHPGIIHLEQLRTIDKIRLVSKIGKIPKNTLAKVDQAISFSLTV